MAEYAWFDLGNGREVYRRVDDGPATKRSHLACPRIASDAMEPVQSQLDGKFYDSKSALRATYKAAGVIEVGNDPARLRPRQKPKIDRRKIRDTIEKATARFERGERA